MKGSVQPDVEGEKSSVGGEGQMSGPVVDIVGMPLMYWTIGGENQCPRPLYLND